MLENYEININQTTLGDVTALHEAVTCQKTELVKLLLRHGAIIRANEDGFTPLHLAANRNDTEISRLLLNHGADAYAKNKDGDTPAHLAASENENAFSFYDIYQEKNERKLEIIFSNPKLVDGVNEYLSKVDFFQKVPLYYKDRINNTLEKHMTAGVERNRSLNNILDTINKDPEEGGPLPNEIKKEILAYLSLEELNRISDAINQVGLSLSISGPSINSSFFKRNSSDPDFDAEEKKPQKKLCIGH